MTASGATSQNIAILSRISVVIGTSLRNTSMLAWIPYSRSVLVAFWAILVFNSPAARK